MSAKVEGKEKESAATKAGALKDKNLQAALASIEKQYGSGSIMRLGDEMSHVDIPVIPTGAFALDLALGVGGIRRGRISEVFGPDSSGIATLVLSVTGTATRAVGLSPVVA